MGKLPQPGRVKTRLCPSLSPDEAAAVHNLFLQHTLARLQASGLPLAKVILCFDPPDADPREYVAIKGVGLLPQSTGNLGDRLVAVTRELGQDHPILFLGCDSPDLPEAHLADALARLRRGEQIVLGPCDDGGFWCLGVAAGLDLRPVVEGVEWSSGRELKQTSDKAKKTSLSVGLSPPWSDVDRPADLATLWERLSRDETPAARRLAQGLALAIGEKTRGRLFADGPRPDTDRL